VTSLGPCSTGLEKGRACLLALASLAASQVFGPPATCLAEGTSHFPSPRAAQDQCPNVEGTCHTVKAGQTLYSLSRAYGVPLPSLVESNEIADPSQVQAGRVLFIPGAASPLEVPVHSAPRLEWPLSGIVTSMFGSARHRDHHEGIDIGGVKGTEIHAAASGTVRWTGIERGYGNVVIIDHGGGLSTLYAHASRLLVEPEEWVEMGEPVAEVGDSGNARGAHLHFEVRRYGQPVDPLSLLGSRIARMASDR
jgi:murein DD-endopeptidase MepM/ murein hydrolase activator NlpD